MQQPSSTPSPLPREAVTDLVALLDQGRLGDAIDLGEHLAASYAPSAPLFNMLGTANLQADRRTEATSWFRKSLALVPDDLDTLHKMGITARELDLKTEAIDCFERILAIRPDLSHFRALKLLLQAEICDWPALREAEDSIATLGVDGRVVSPHLLLALEDRPDCHKIRSERYSEAAFPQLPPPPEFRPKSEPQHLKIGYFSADIHDHAVARRLARIIELHDRERFEIHVYAYRPIVEDETRARIMATADCFHDVAGISDEDLAQRVQRDLIDIAVDLTGHATHSRTRMFAHRPAPVLMSWLGYPGTIGAPFVDYIIADRTVLPEDQRLFFTETPIYLPYSVQAQDDQAPLAERPPSRALMGLPEQGFVFCGMNDSSRITPALYDIWMRLLGKVTGSVLWLFRSNAWVEEKLRAETEARGIDPARIVFTDWKPWTDYLAQFGAADLFLDSFDHNAGTTAADALWAGLPVLTRPGVGYAARTTASMLGAIGLNDLITPSDDAYERLALELATDPGRLGAIRAKLQANRKTEPLFDSGLITRRLEEAYWIAYRRWFNGQPLAVIDVPAEA